MRFRYEFVFRTQTLELACDIKIIIMETQRKLDAILEFVLNRKANSMIQLVQTISSGIQKRNNLIRKALIKEKNHNIYNFETLLKIQKHNDIFEKTISDRIHDGNLNKILRKMIKDSKDLNTHLKDFVVTQTKCA